MSLFVSNTKKNFKISAESKKILSASKIAANKAIKKSKRLGLDITFLENGKIYKETPNGKRILISTIATSNQESIDLKLTKGMVLNVKF